MSTKLSFGIIRWPKRAGGSVLNRTLQLKKQCSSSNCKYHTQLVLPWVTRNWGKILQPVELISELSSLGSLTFEKIFCHEFFEVLLPGFGFGFIESWLSHQLVCDVILAHFHHGIHYFVLVHLNSSELLQNKGREEMSRHQTTWQL